MIELKAEWRQNRSPHSIFIKKMSLTLILTFLLLFCYSWFLSSSSITPIQPPRSKLVRSRNEDNESDDESCIGTQSDILSLAGLLESRPPSTPLWIDQETMFHLYGQLLATETQDDFNKLLHTEMKNSSSNAGIPGMSVYGDHRLYYYMKPTSLPVPLKEVKTFSNRISTHFTPQLLTTMLRSPQNITHQNEINVLINRILDVTDRKKNGSIFTLTKAILHDPDHAVVVKVVRFLKLLISGGVICFEDLGITDDISIRLPEISIKEVSVTVEGPGKAQKLSGSSSPKNVSPDLNPKFYIPACFTDTKLLSLSTILFLEVFLDNYKKLPDREEYRTPRIYAQQVLKVLHPFWEKFQGGKGIKYPDLKPKQFVNSIAVEAMERTNLLLGAWWLCGSYRTA
jgi:hypothetical protein